MPPPEFLEQAAFRQMLHLEAKRAQRSGTAFILVRVEAPGLFGNPGRAAAGEKLLRELCGSLRDTDVCGWYQEQVTAGIVFTEQEPATAPSVGNLLVSGLSRRLAAAFETTELDRLRLSFSIIPDQGGLAALQSVHAEHDTSAPETVVAQRESASFLRSKTR